MNFEQFFFVCKRTLNSFLADSIKGSLKLPRFQTAAVESKPECCRQVAHNSKGEISELQSTPKQATATKPDARKRFNQRFEQ